KRGFWRVSRPEQVSFTPKADIHPRALACPLCARSGHNARYSITSSARASNVEGTERLRALAVLRLMTSSNLVGCCTGRSAGLMPLRIRATYVPARRYISVVSASPPKADIGRQACQERTLIRQVWPRCGAWPL